MFGLRRSVDEGVAEVAKFSRIQFSWFELALCPVPMRSLVNEVSRGDLPRMNLVKAS